MSLVKPSLRMFAAFSPPAPRGVNTGKRWIATWTISHTAKEAKAKAGYTKVGGWASLARKGWVIGRVDVIEHVREPEEAAN